MTRWEERIVNWPRINKSAKYLKKLLFTISLLLVAMVIIVSGVLFYGAEKAMVDLNLKGNQKVLSQLRFNIDYMNDNLKNVVITQYFDNRNYPLMYANQIDTFEMLSRIRNLDRFVDSSPFLQSIVMYNAIQNIYYTGGSMEMLPENDVVLAEIDRFIKQERNIPKLSLIPIRINGSLKEDVDVFSMFMYEGSGSIQKSMLMINIKPEWLFDNLNLLNTFVDNEGGTIGVIDQSGNILSPTASNLRLQPESTLQVMQQIETSNVESGQFMESIDGEEHVVTYMSTDLNEWTLVIVQPYSSLIEQINKLKIVALMIILGFILIAFICAIVISFRLYRPIQRLLGHVRPTSNSEFGNLPSNDAIVKDELDYIESAYKGVLTKLDSIKRDYDQNRSIVRSYHAKSLILESHSLSQPDYEQKISKHGLHITQGVHQLMALQIDKAAQFRESLNTKEQKLLQFAIRNIAEHILTTIFQVELIESKEDLIVLLLSSQDEVDQAEAVSLAQQIQVHVEQYYRISLTVVLGESSCDHQTLSHHYTQLHDMCLYRMISGHGSIIRPSMMKQGGSDHDLIKFDDLNKKISEAIRMNHKIQAEDYLADVFHFLQQLQPDQMMHSLLTMLTNIRQVLDEVNKNRLQAISIPWNQYIRKVTELETLTDAKRLFIRLLSEITAKQLDEQQEKYRILVETIKEMIETGYADVNLSLQTISDSLGMTNAHVSRVFRNSETLAIHDYIREVRLKNALHLLENSECTIAEITERVGYGNISNFFRHFKKKHGTTPKEYRLKRTIENNTKE